MFLQSYNTILDCFELIAIGASQVVTNGFDGAIKMTLDFIFPSLIGVVQLSHFCHEETNILLRCHYVLMVRHKNEV